MYFKQLVKEDLGCASYIVGCPDAGVCAVIDPRLDMVDEILELTTARGLQIKAVIETHNHADHISGHGELARRTGASIYIYEQAGVAYPHKKLKDGDELQFGFVKLRVMLYIHRDIAPSISHCKSPTQLAVMIPGWS